MDGGASVGDAPSCIEVSLKCGVALDIYRLVKGDIASRLVVDVLAEELVELRGIGAERGRTVSYPRTVCIGCTVCVVGIIRPLGNGSLIRLLGVAGIVDRALLGDGHAGAASRSG